ncbi:hypothetical protein MHYP_G00364770 [Metynnis hypsauchen]
MTSERRPPERPTLSGVMLIDLIKCSFLLTCPPDSFDHLGASLLVEESHSSRKEGLAIAFLHTLGPQEWPLHSKRPQPPEQW